MAAFNVILSRRTIHGQRLSSLFNILPGAPCFEGLIPRLWICFRNARSAKKCDELTIRPRYTVATGGLLPRQALQRTL